MKYWAAEAAGSTPPSDPSPWQRLRHACKSMRLTAEQQRGLHAALRRCFGASARLWLFGSRTDDRARGGDYDLLVQTDEPDATLLIEAKLAFLAELHGTPAFDGLHSCMDRAAGPAVDRGSARMTGLISRLLGNTIEQACR